MERLLVPTDSEGRKCGVDSEVVNKPYLVFFNLEKCIDPSVPLYGCKTPQVCVEQCPTSSFVFSQCTASNFYQIKSQLICRMNVNKERIQTCNDISAMVSNEQCARWYLKSESCKLLLNPQPNHKTFPLSFLFYRETKVKHLCIVLVLYILTVFVCVRYASRDAGQ